MRDGFTLFLKTLREFAIFVTMIWWFVEACSTLATRELFLLGLVLMGAWLGAAAVLARRTWRVFLATEIGRQFARDFNIKLLPRAATVVVVLLAAQSIGCGYKYIEPGFVGVQVDKYGTQRGVKDFPVVTGVIWYLPWTTAIYEYPTFVQTAIWTQDVREGSPTDEAIRYNSKEGLVFIADVSLSYQLVAEKVPAFYVQFRSDDLTRFTHGLMHNLARDAFNELAPQYTSEQLYSEKKEILLQQAKARINEWVSPYGVIINQFGYLGAPRPPEAIVNAINGKIQATQDAIRVENEVAKSKAEALKGVAIAEGESKQAIARAEGQAQANKLLAQSLTEPLMRWRELDLQQRSIDKWSGAVPTVMGSGGLLFNIPTGDGRAEADHSSATAAASRADRLAKLNQ